MSVEKKRTTLAVIAGAMLLIAAGMTAWSYKTIHLQVDGQVSTLRGFAWTVSDALRLGGISLAAADRVEPATTQWLGWESTVQVARAAHFILVAEGHETLLFSVERLPTQLLKEAGLELYPGDILLVDGTPIDSDQELLLDAESRQGPLLELRRAKSFELVEGGSSQEFISTAPSLGAALYQAGLSLHTTDQITPTLHNAIEAGLTVHLRRARPVTIAASGITITLSTTANLVGQALAQAGLAPQGLDYAIPSETESIPADGKIRLVRVSEEVLIEQTPLPFETSYQPADDVEIDSRVVLQAGEYGITAQRVRVRYEDGVEISRDVETEWVAKAPQDHMIGYGTQIVQHTVDTPDGPIVYWRALQMYAVSYHPGETGGDITASGLKVRKGLAAVDIRYIPFFTEMYVPGYGPAMAADTGGGVVGRMIDLAYPTDEYVAWHEYVTVYFLWPPPANIVWIIP